VVVAQRHDIGVRVPGMLVPRFAVPVGVRLVHDNQRRVGTDRVDGLNDVPHGPVAQTPWDCPMQIVTQVGSSSVAHTAAGDPHCVLVEEAQVCVNVLRAMGALHVREQ